MSTRSCIILKVRKEDIGKVMKFNESLLPVSLENWGDDTTKDMCQPVEINNMYIGIYCHWDGYPSGVGAELVESFKDYNEVLNLIIGGSCSSISSSFRHYANRQGEKWEYLVPQQGKTQKELVEHFRDSWAEYAYLFDENRGGWRYKEICGSPVQTAKRGFKPVK